MKYIVSLTLISISLISCSTNDRMNAGENVSNENLNLSAQLNSLDAQLNHLDAMINAAKARKDMTHTDSSHINNLTIENEILGYESQKTSIKAQKNTLQMQVKP
jgi:hypothetical protein